MQIVNLCPLESEEAKALIPSSVHSPSHTLLVGVTEDRSLDRLQKLDDEELQEMLTEIASLRRLQ